MFTLELDTSSDVRRWHVAEGWRCGRNVILPIRHPALESFALSDGQRYGFICRERGELAPQDTLRAPILCSQADYDSELHACRAWPLDWQIVEIDTLEGRLLVRFKAGRLGVLPLYIHASGNLVSASWNLGELIRAVAPRLNSERAAHLLLGNIPYGAETLFEGVMMLTRSSTIHVTDHGLEIHYPDADILPGESNVCASIDIVSEFETLIGDVLNRALGEMDQRTVIELSGGLDSATMALLSVPAGRRLTSVGLILPGPSEAMQRVRRDEIVRLCGMDDVTVDARAFAPLSRQQRQLNRAGLAPLDEVYSEAFDALFSRISQSGAQMVCTGTGGDELFLHARPEALRPRDLSTWIRQRVDRVPHFVTARAKDVFADTVISCDRAPVSVIADSVSIAQASRAGTFVRAGLWPLHVFATPEVASFCRRLPRTWCKDKQLFEAIAARRGVRHMSTRSAFPETFHELFAIGLHGAGKFVLTDLFADLSSALRELVCVDDLCQAFAQWLTGEATVNPFAFYQIAAMELSIRQTRAPRRSGLSPISSYH